MSYAKNQATATRLLTKYGRPVTLRLVTTGTYSPTTGTVTNTTTDETRNAAIFDYARGEVTDAGTLIQVGDKKCYMDADGTEPKADDLVVFDSVSYTIKTVGIIKPATVAIIYELQLRA